MEFLGGLTIAGGVSIVPPVTLVYSLYSWGFNSGGQLGLGDMTSKSSPTQVGTGSSWTSIDTGGENPEYQLTVAVKSDGTLWTWGFNNSGQLGFNDRINRSSPVQVGSSTDWSSVSTNGQRTAAIKTNGTLWVWGSGGNDSLGLNNTISRSSPTQLGSDTNWSKVSIGYRSALVTKTTGTLWAWGFNGSGELGLNNQTSEFWISSPTQVGALTNWNEIKVGRQSVLATKTDGTLWVWGYNGQGTLGLNDGNDKSSPVQVGSATNWSKVSTGVWSSAAIKTDGTLWTWGSNSSLYNSYVFGQLGLNDSIKRSSPTQVGSDTNWSKVSTGGNHMIATKTTGTLWAWGANKWAGDTAGGQLGLSNTLERSSPTQVGSGTGWNLISAGGYASVATTSS